MHITKPYMLIVVMILLPYLAACSSTPDFDTANVDQSLTPQSTTTESEPNSQGKTVLWGGTILDIQNLKESTQLEVLAYPLNTYQRPILGQTPLGRFIVLQPGYLEPATYSRGRSITVVGNIREIQSGKVGDSAYKYPVINAQQLHLWPVERERSSTGFHLGVGIGL